MNGKLRILHKIFYHEDDYDSGHLVILIIKDGDILGVMAIKYVFPYFYCPDFGAYKFGGIGSN